MNYLAHGYRFLERPYMVAGTAVPDWLRVVGRRIDRSFLDRASPAPDGHPAADLAAGIAEHLRDDARFHACAPFRHAAGEITREIRRRFPENPRLRAHFLGHVLAEMLLDAALAGAAPWLLDGYYQALEAIDPRTVERAVNGWIGAPARPLGRFIREFRSLEFLRDYGTDEGLARRVAQVARRAGLPPLPSGFERVLPPSRTLVERRAGALLASSGRPAVLSGVFEDERAF